MYTCPKCKKELILHNHTYICPENHSFDISSSGYVNLILGSKPLHGDNKLMISARRRFLQSGKYYIIIEALTKLLKNLTDTKTTVIDAGCGEGYYTSALKNALPSCDFYGFDVSKEAIILAAKSHKTVNFSVASVKNMPFPDNSAEVILSLFSPLCEEEFTRVLKPGGVLITVSPSPEHLFELKSQIYNTPYKNPPSTFIPKLLKKVNEFEISDEMVLENNNIISDLFTMTPYCYNTGKNGRKKVEKLEKLCTKIGFVFGVYQNI